jgi:hypothetical protein
MQKMSTASAKKMGIGKKLSSKKHGSNRGSKSKFSSKNSTILITPPRLRRSNRLAGLPVLGLAPNAPNRFRIAARAIQAGVRLRRNLTTEFVAVAEAEAEATRPPILTRDAWNNMFRAIRAVYGTA